ncbi:MAG: helix-turn-helix domain-containing protein [Pleurocapsa sp. MO_226.B13]|nr:helix-turn-helix domain-containing protein [Pleurocapsa sp. MO_226.B13]
MIVSNSKYVYSGKAAALLDVSIKTLVKWVDEGHLHCIRQGKNRKFSLAEIERFKQSDFYRSKKPKYTLIYVREKNSIERRKWVDRARNYCKRQGWATIVVSESVSELSNLNTLYFQQAFNYFYERKIERLICCDRDEVSKILATLVRHRGLSVLNIHNL